MTKAANWSGSGLPSLDELTGLLGSLLASDGPPGQPGVTVLSRRRNAYAGTFPSEIVTCKLDDGERLRFFCKYGAGHQHASHGHRGGVSYEMAVYHNVLQHLSVPLLRYYGSGAWASGNWLVIEFADGAVRVNTRKEDGVLRLAADWAGHFHAQARSFVSAEPPLVLTRYNDAYFRGWVERTLVFSRDLARRLPWLPSLSEWFLDSGVPLLVRRPTVIHGEFYPRNVLSRGTSIYPVDWESAAVGAGEIDLAMLTEGWPEQIVRDCELGYQQARWPGGPPPDFGPVLEAARLYLHFRWLGDRPEWTRDPGSGWYFEQMLAAGERLGLL